MRFREGEAVVSRFVWFGKVANAKPVTVVEDSDELIALYLAPGTQFRRSGTADRRSEYPHRLVARDWTLYDDVWQRHRTLVLHRPGSAHCILGFWPEEGGELVTWYVNLEEPLRRTSIGFDGRDLFLDVLVAPDGAWTWKDEDEFEEARRLGLLSADEAGAVRAEGERVIAEVESGRMWWTSWSSWAPDPAWPVPALPDGWDRVD